jgi:hypothetical protein
MKVSYSTVDLTKIVGPSKIIKKGLEIYNFSDFYIRHAICDYDDSPRYEYDYMTCKNSKLQAEVILNSKVITISLSSIMPKIGGYDSSRKMLYIQPDEQLIDEVDSAIKEMLQTFNEDSPK